MSCAKERREGTTKNPPSAIAVKMKLNPMYE